jgi:acyl phosphate:glycerol-3-phosphate acyltransferase
VYRPWWFPYHERVSRAPLLLGSYLLGTFPSADLVGRALGRDVSREGSGNPGASNVYRLAGAGPAALVFAADAAKGAAATAVGLRTGGRAMGTACGVAAVLGHCFPVSRGTKGGKGVATAFGTSAVLHPSVVGVLAFLWVVVARGVGKASLASLAAAGGLPVGVAATTRSRFEVAAAAGVAVLIVSRHHSNLSRLLRGEEPGL